MSLNSNKVEGISDPDDSEASIDLTDADKDYIKEIMIRHRIKGSFYFTKYRPCLVCDKIRLSSNPQSTNSFFDICFMEHENDFDFTKEKRRKIIQSVVHEFFESEAEKERDRVKKINFHSKNTKIREAPHKYVVKKKSVSRVKKEVRTSTVKSFESTKATDKSRPKELTTTTHITSSTRPPITRTNLTLSERKQYHNKITKMSLRTANAKTHRPSLRSAIGKTTVISRVAPLKLTVASKENHPCKEKDFLKPPVRVKQTRWNKVEIDRPEEIKQPPKIPMKDPESPFYISEECMDTALYQEGLAVREWNPTQALYEICGYCEWGKPEFLVGGNGYTGGFLSCVRVRGFDFMGSIRGQTKKIAMHLASTKFLNHIGFKFGPGSKPQISQKKIFENNKN